MLFLPSMCTALPAHDGQPVPLPVREWIVVFHLCWHLLHSHSALLWDPYTIEKGSMSSSSLAISGNLWPREFLPSMCNALLEHAGHPEDFFPVLLEGEIVHSCLQVPQSHRTFLLLPYTTESGFNSLSGCHSDAISGNLVAKEFLPSK